MEKIDRVIAIATGTVIATGTPFGLYTSIARYGQFTSGSWLLWGIVSLSALWAGIGIIRCALRR